jgi:hypothetical protein
MHSSNSQFCGRGLPDLVHKFRRVFRKKTRRIPCQQLLSEINRQQTSLDPEVFCAAFTAPGVNFDFVRNLLTFCQAGKPRPFDGADVDKHIVSAIVRLDKAKTLLAVEPFDNACRHSLLQSITRVTTHAIPFNWSMSLGKSPPAHSKRNSG